MNALFAEIPQRILNQLQPNRLAATVAAIAQIHAKGENNANR